MHAINNPFLNQHGLTTNASINKLHIAQMPTCSVSQELTGKKALDIFSTALFIKEIKRASDKLEIDVCHLEEKSLPMILEQCLLTGSPAARDEARRLLKLFGERLAVILLCLKEGAEKNQTARPDWKEEHWDYWRSLKKVILVGGLSSPPLGEHLKHYVEQVFEQSEKHPYQIMIGQDSTYAGIRGCARFLAEDEAEDGHVTYSSLIFDYGQSFIKRSCVMIERGKVKDIILLEKTLSKHVEWDVKDKKSEWREALLLNDHFLQTITQTIKEVEGFGLPINPHIVLSIANYVKDGAVVDRGGYGKLRLIAPNYGSYLTTKLKELLHKDFTFTLIHDGTAMAAGYTEHDNCVCLSLGTAFGVGFPDYFQRRKTNDT